MAERDAPPPLRSHWLLLVQLVLPAGLLLHAGGKPLGRSMFDLVGHLWMIWNGQQGSLTRSALLAYPDGVDLLPVVGGWLDILLGSTFYAMGADLVLAYDLVIVTYLAVAGLGGHALARVAGAPPLAAVLGGLLLQLSPLLIDSLNWGRAEQVGMGFVALAVAGALHSWRSPGWRPAVATGLAGAAVIYASWEYSLMLALGMGLLLPFLLWWSRGADRPALAASLRSWGLAAGTTTLVAGPWVAQFLVRSMAVRRPGDPSFAANATERNSVALLDWFTRGHMRPAPLLLLCLLALPLVVPRRDRRIWLGIGLGLLLTLLLALGPSPQLHGVDSYATQAPRGPFAVLHSLPVLQWFHWPDRYLLAWALALPVAGSLAVTRVGRLHPALGGLLGIALVGSSWWNLAGQHQWVELGDPPDRPAPLDALARLDAEGAVLDLPVLTDVTLAQRYQLAQLVHGRPILSHGTMKHLLPPGHLAWTHDVAALTWFEDLPKAEEQPPLQRVDFDPLVERGYRFVVLHPLYSEEDSAEARQALHDALGEPLVDLTSWALWWIPVEGETEPVVPEVDWPDDRLVQVFPPKPKGEEAGNRAQAGPGDAATRSGPPPHQEFGTEPPPPPPGETQPAPLPEEEQSAREAADERHHSRPRPQSRRDR